MEASLEFCENIIGFFLPTSITRTCLGFVCFVVCVYPEARHWHQVSLSIALPLTFLDRVSHWPGALWANLDGQQESEILLSLPPQNLEYNLLFYFYYGQFRAIRPRSSYLHSKPSLQPLIFQFYSWSNRGKKACMRKPSGCPFRWWCAC